MGRRRGPHRVVQKHIEVQAFFFFGGKSQGCTTIWFQCFWGFFCFGFFSDRDVKNNPRYFPLFLIAICFLCVCTALTEPGQLPLGSHRAAGLVWRSPGLPATFRAKSHGMSDGTKTPIMVFIVFFISFKVLLRRHEQNNNYMLDCKEGLHDFFLLHSPELLKKKIQ